MSHAGAFPEHTVADACYRSGKGDGFKILAMRENSVTQALYGIWNRDMGYTVAFGKNGIFNLNYRVGDSDGSQPITPIEGKH